MNQLNSEREAMLIPGAIIESGSRSESCTDPTEDRYQVCGIAKDHKAEYVVVYQALFGERETHTCPIQNFLGIGETKTVLGETYHIPKFRLCKETIEVSQNIINSGIKDPTTTELLGEIASLRKELKHMSRDLKKLQKLTAPLKEIKPTKGEKKVIPAPMPVIPVPSPITTPYVLPTSPTCAVTPTDAMNDVKNEAIEAVTTKAPDMVQQAAKAFDKACNSATAKGHKIRMIEEDK